MSLTLFRYEVERKEFVYFTLFLIEQCFLKLGVKAGR